MLIRLALLAIMAGSLFLNPAGIDKSQPNPQPIPGASSYQSPSPSACSPRPICLENTVLDTKTCSCVPFPPII
jgi:hypothetical protein